MVSIFSMPTDSSASSRVSAVLVPHIDRFTTEWSDEPGDVTVLRVHHEESKAEMLSALLHRAHPRVQHVSSQRPS